MGMVVRTNTMALNAYRQLGMNNSAVAKSLEKLSSGFRINRAGDDAAGLAISEKMKAQIKGLETASANAQDGISLIQTAEGNLNEVHDMLNRMVELATKSANGTYTQTERDALQDEVDALKEEIDRISQSANFNGTNLLDGTMGLNSKAFGITAEAAVSAQDGKIAGGDLVQSANFHPEQASTTGAAPSAKIDLGDLTIKDVAGGAVATIKITVLGQEYSVSITNTGTGVTDIGVTAIADALAKKMFAADNGSIKKVQTSDGDTAGTTPDGVIVNDMAFSVTAAGGVISLDFKGFYKTVGSTAKTDYTVYNNSAANIKFTDGQANAINGTLGAAVTIGDVTGGTKGGNYVVHATTNVEQAVAKVDGGFAGADIKLTADLMTEGSTLTIDGKTFTFHTQKKADGTAYNGAGDIDLSDIVKKDGEPDNDFNARLIHKAVDQLSKQTFTNADGEKRGWKIASKGPDTIHIEQIAKTDTAGKELKSVDDIKKLVEGVAAGKIATAQNVGTKITIKDASQIQEGDGLTIDGTQYVFTTSAKAPNDTDKVKYVKMKADGSDAAANLATKIGNGAKVEADGKSIILRAATPTDGSDPVAPSVMGKGLTLQIGDTADAFNKMNVLVADMSTKALGLGDLKITSETLSSDAIAKIKTAINTVSTTRAGMGALQNRLEHTINNLDVAAENLSAANSRIRDTDMAKEMMNYTKMNVLVQSAQAMLAQANQQPQSVLQLLQ